MTTLFQSDPPETRTLSEAVAAEGAAGRARPTPETRTLAEAVAAAKDGQRLSLAEGILLYERADLHTLGELANGLRQRLHGRNAYYNVNRHINYTNFCVLRCKFCSFYRPYPKDEPRNSFRDPNEPPISIGVPNEPRISIRGAGDDAPHDPLAQYSKRANDTYELSVEEVVDRARQAYEAGATEVHIVGGLHPKLPFVYYTEMCRALRAACPKLHIKAFTAIEIIHFTRISKPKLSVWEVLTALMEAGLDSMPGGGAEIFDDRVHDEVFKNKVGEVEWFEVHRTAHELGLFTNATMLYGHVETPAERVAHLVKLRQHQDESLKSRRAHFNCVIPLSFIPEGSALSHLPGPTGLMDLRTLAISRLMLDNVSHVKAFWIMQSPQLAQVSLNWGVDDVDGTVVYYDITKREGHGTTHQELTVDTIRRLICEAGCVPVERDSLYRRVIREGRNWQVAAF